MNLPQILIPVDGCSINPTRTIGPAIVATVANRLPPENNVWYDMWVFWIGPLTGAALAALMSMFWWHPNGFSEVDKEAEAEQERAKKAAAEVRRLREERSHQTDQQREEEDAAELAECQ